MRLRMISTLLSVCALAGAQMRFPAALRGGLVEPPLPKPGFVLTDTSGSPFDFRQKTAGYLTLLFFGYTNCPDQCPMHVANLNAALKKLPPGLADQVKFVFVTTDPERDSAVVLRRWLDLFNRRFIGLTGTGKEIAAAQNAAGVPPAKKDAASGQSYAVSHANFVLAYSKDGFAHVLYPGGVGSEDWVHDLPLLIQETWRR